MRPIKMLPPCLSILVATSHVKRCSTIIIGNRWATIGVQQLPDKVPDRCMMVKCD